MAMFLSSADIASVLGISRRNAQYMIAMFADQGKTVRGGKSDKVQRVGINTFASYLCEQDGESLALRKKEISDYLKGEKRNVSR